MTQQASKRWQQRTIPAEMLQIITLYGDETPQKGGNRVAPVEQTRHEKRKERFEKSTEAL